MFIFVFMNTTKKLRELGFSKIPFHKPYEYNDGSHTNMVLDNVTKKWERKKDGSYGWTEIPKVHPKANSFWKLDFNERYTIWISVVNHIIYEIWFEDKLKKRPIGYYRSRSSLYDEIEPLQTIYRYDPSNKIVSKKQIVNLLPKDIKRDFIIKDLLR